MLTCSIGDFTKAKLSYALDAIYQLIPTGVDVISKTRIQQPEKEKQLILKTRAHSFQTANISYTHIS